MDSSNSYTKHDCCEYRRLTCVLVRRTVQVNMPINGELEESVMNQIQVSCYQNLFLYLFRATPHRVRFYGDTGYLDRYSIALFVHPNSDVRLTPFKQEDTHSMPEKSSEEKDDENTMTALEYVNKRFSETYINKKQKSCYHHLSCIVKFPAL